MNVYIEICQNLNEYKKRKQVKIKRKIIKKILEDISSFKFKIMTKLNLIQEEEKDEKKYLIIYKSKHDDEKIIKKLNKKISNILNKNPDTKIILSIQIKNLSKEIESKNKQNIKNQTEKCKSAIQTIIEYYEENKEIYNNYIENIVYNTIKSENEIPEEQSIYVLIKTSNSKNINKIMNMLSTYKMINIITPNTKDFSKLENRLEDNLETINVLNNKRKSLSRAKYIINFDFKKEEILQYQINRTAIIFNINYDKIYLINFDGIIINNVKIKNKEGVQFDQQDEYIVDKTNEKSISNCINNQYYKMIGNNGEIANTELLNIKN